jgi:hypothetical protein
MTMQERQAVRPRGAFLCVALILYKPGSAAQSDGAVSCPADA